VNLSEIRGELEQIAGRWRTDTCAEQEKDLSDLDELLGEIDELEIDRASAAEMAEELRNRIEILMDEIDISLGIEPPPITGHAGYDVDPATGST
jgi:hypothetical protein